MDKLIDRRRTALYSVQPAYALCLGFPVPTDWYLQVEKQSTTHEQAWFIPSE